MNNDLNQNTRTLIIAFSFALMVLVPLRFVEVGNMSQAMVLGDSIEMAAPRIEEPYASMETVCLDDKYVNKVILFLDNEKLVKGVTKSNKDKIDLEIARFELERCR